MTKIFMAAFTFVMLAAQISSATCYIADQEGVAEKYAVVLNAYIFADNSQLVDPTTLPPAVKACLSEVDLGVELGDGYYDIKWTETYAIYFDAEKTRLAGYVEVSGVNYTEDESEDEMEYVVRYNEKGQRVSRIGDYGH